MLLTRRSFLQQTSAAAVAAGTMAPLADRALWDRPAAEFVGEPDEAQLKELMLAAVDEARKAGATFADIRLNAARLLGLNASAIARMPKASGGGPMIGFGNAYGIRAIVDGAWGFSGGFGLTKDAVINNVRLAVQGARANKPRQKRDLELAPRPVVDNGRWDVTVERDPFTVKMADQVRVMQDALEPVRENQNPVLYMGSLNCTWRNCLTMYASTDGSMVVQRIITASVGGTTTAFAGKWPHSSRADVGIKGFLTGPYGFEALVEPTIKDRVRVAIDEVIELALRTVDAKSTDVGRFDLVMAPWVTASLLNMTVAEALRLSRVLGYEANDVGTSFAGPPADMLGKYKIGAPSLTVHADRSQPKGCATVGWDEEGVKPDDFTLVKDGVIVDYFADRQMAMELKDWYTGTGKPVRAHGLASRTGDQRPLALVPNLTMEPGKASTTVDDLIRGTKRGFFIEGYWGATDQQVINTQAAVGPPMVRRIVNGKLGEHVRDLSFQFITTPFWKGLDAIGGAASATSFPITTDEFSARAFYEPHFLSTIRAVPIRVRDVNVLNTGRTA